jgi:hypothetical protein
LEVDARDNEPYVIQVTATDDDPDMSPAVGEFNLTISALDRANVSLDIGVAPDTAMLNDELSWTFTVSAAAGLLDAPNVSRGGCRPGQRLQLHDREPAGRQLNVRP